MIAAEGRSVRTSLAVPRVRIETPATTVRIPNGAAGDEYRLSITGGTEPGNLLERDGKPVPLSSDGAFSDSVDLRAGENLLGFVARSPAGVTRILNLDLGVSGEQRREATAR
jgi:hypothetical protein